MSVSNLVRNDGNGPVQRDGDSRLVILSHSSNATTSDSSGGETDRHMQCTTNAFVDRKDRDHDHDDGSVFDSGIGDAVDDPNAMIESADVGDGTSAPINPATTQCLTTLHRKSSVPPSERGRL